MQSITIAVDLAKDIVQLAVATPSGRIAEGKRLARARSERFWQTREPCAVVTEVCGSANPRTRMLVARGVTVRLLHAHSVHQDVAIQSVNEQAALSLHHAREQWKQTRTPWIDDMRGLLQEAGITAPLGAAQFLARLPQMLKQH